MAEPIVYKTIERFPGFRFRSDGIVECCRARGGAGLKPPGWHLGSKWYVKHLMVDRDGYLRSFMYENGKQRGILVHRLILEAFVGPPPAGKNFCAHYNGIRNDNRIENLRWCSPQENSNDMRRHGTSTEGVRNPSAKLTEKQVREIRRRCKTETAISLSREYGVNDRSICNVLLRRTWTHID